MREQFEKIISYLKIIEPPKTVGPVTLGLEKSFSQNKIIGQNFWHYIESDFPTLSKEGICSGLCIDYARHVINHRNTNTPSDYLAKLNRKFTLFGKSSKNFARRIQSYQDLQPSFFTELEQLDITGDKNPLDYLSAKLQAKSLIYLSLSNEKSAHAIVVYFDRNNTDISSYKIFEPNFGEYKVNDRAECGIIIKRLCNYYGYETCKAFDVEKFLQENQLVKNLDNTYAKKYKYIETNPNSDNLKAMQLRNACYDGKTEVIKLLLADPRVDINKADSNQLTPLYRACYKGKTEVITLLLADPRVDVNKADSKQFTPLSIACYKPKKIS